MATGVVYSTLMVILSHSQQDFEEFWTQTGSVNDPTGTKHEQYIGSIVRDGNYRSSLIDNWDIQEFLSVSVCGTNTNGDILWETEFNTTDLSYDLSSWFTGSALIKSTADTTVSQETTVRDRFYSIRIGPSGSPDKSWFAVSYGVLSFSQIPVVLIPRHRNIPFSLPVITDGLLGCWSLSSLINSTLMTSVSGMTPDLCISMCDDIFNTAVLVSAQKCYCAVRDPDNLPVDESTKCFLPCSDGQQCGGFGSTEGSAYHVQGSEFPGEVDEITLYSNTYYNVDFIQIDIADILPQPAPNAFISSLEVTSIPEVTFSIQYSYSACAETNIRKNVSFDAPIIFTANGDISNVDILRVGCVELILDSVVTSATVELCGPDPSSEHVPVSAVVVRATSASTETTSTSTSTSTTSSTTTTPTTTSTTSTTSSTTTSPTTSSTTSTTTSPTTSTTSTPTTSTTSTPTTSTSTSSTTSSSTPTSTSTTTSSTTAQLTSSTTLSTSSIPPPTTTTAAKCACSCQDTLPQLNITVEELQEKIEAIQKKLSVNVSELSSTIRKLTSAEDERVSARSIGYVGIGILVGMFGIILFIDSAMLIRDIGTFFHNISHICHRK